MKKRGFSLVEVLVSLGITALVITLLFPIFTEQIKLGREQGRIEEMESVFRNTWEKAVGGERNLSEEIQGKYDTYSVYIRSKKASRETEEVTIEVTGGRHENKREFTGYLEETGLYND